MASSKSILPQDSGVGAFLKITNQIDLLRDSREQNILTRSLKGLARFVATYTLMTFFAQGGLIYNAAGCVLNAALGLTCVVIDRDKAALYLMGSFKNVMYGLVDLVGFFTNIVGVTSLAYAVIPSTTLRIYSQIDYAISGANSHYRSI